MMEKKSENLGKNQLIAIPHYASHRRREGLRGVTRQAIKKAIDSGRLSKSIQKVGKRYMIISVEQADKEWENKTTPDVQVDQVEKHPELDLKDDETSKKYRESRARRIKAHADKAEIELAQIKGESLDLKIAGREITKIAKELVQGMTNISRQQAIPLSIETNPQKIRTMLQDIHKKLIQQTIRKLKKITTNE